MLDGNSTLEGLIVVNGDDSWVDYEVETAVVIMADSTSNREASIVLRYFDPQNFYWLGLGCWGHKICISKYYDGVPGPLVYSGVDEDIVYGQKYTLKAVVYGSIIKLYLDGNLVLSYEDTLNSTIPSGPGGLRIWGSHAQFDYFDAKEYIETGVNITFSGTVKDKIDNTPIVDASGVVTVTLPDSSTEEIPITSDQNGEFSVVKTYSTTGSYSGVASLSKVGYNDGVSEIVNFTVGEVLKDMEVILNVIVN